MAIEHVHITDATGASVPIAVDTGTEGEVQLFKLAYSADGSTTLCLVDADGIEVQLSKGVLTSITNTVTVGGTVAVTADALTALAGAITGTEVQVDVITLPAITGTVTAELSATDKAVLDAIAAGFGTQGDDTGDGVLIQGWDSHDRTNILVDTDGHLKVDIVDGITGAVTVSGTVTANLSATDNAVLDTIDAVLDTIKTDTTTIAGAVAATHLQCDVLSAPSTAVTNADLTTIAGAVAGGHVQVDVLAAPSTAVTNADITSCKTALEIIDDWDSSDHCNIRHLNTTDDTVNIADGGNTITVDGTVTANLSATDNAVLDTIDAVLDTIDADTSVLAGAVADGHVQVDVLTGGGAGVQYTEGDIDATITGTAAMWEDGSDTLRAVSATKPLPVNVVAGGGTGGTALADDADFAAGTTPGNPIMGVYESSPTQVTDGDIGMVGMTSDRRLKVNLGGVGISGDQLEVLAELSATDNAVLDAIDAAIDTIKTDTTTLAGAVASTHLQCDVLSAPSTAVTNADMTTVAGAVSGTHMQCDVLTAPAVRALTNADVVTAELSATDNAVLDTIDAVLDTIDADTSILAGGVSGTHYQCDVLTAPAVRALTNADVVTAELSATDNAVLDTIDAVLDTIDADTSIIQAAVVGTHMQCDVLSAPSTAVTNADMTTVAGAVAGGHMQVDVLTAPSTAVTNADITSCKTALELLDNSVDGAYLNVNMNIAGTDIVGGAGAVAAGVQRVTHASDDPAVTALQVIDNCISGSEAQVDVVAALPTGTNTIGKVKIADNGSTMKKIKVALAASQTGTTVLDPTNSTKFVIKKMIVSCKTAGDVYFFDDTDDATHAIGPALTLAIGGGWTETWGDEALYVSETADHILKYTSGAGLTGSVYVEYTEV
jgi:hypothetical protein